MKTQQPPTKQASARRHSGNSASTRADTARKRGGKLRVGIRRIIVPTDFSEESKKALIYAHSLAEKYDASIELLFVVEPASFFTGLDQSLVTVSNEDAAEAAEGKLVKLANELGEGELHLFPRVRIGKAYAEICALAREHNADLIVMSTHGHTGLKHTVLGSVAERVVRHAPCPVLVVREHENEFLTESEEEQ